MLKLKIFQIGLFICLTTNFAYAYLLGNSSNDSDDSQTRRLNLHSHHHISSATKTTAKIAACATVAKGICLGVDGVKYIKKEASESDGKESASYTPAK